MNEANLLENVGAVEFALNKIDFLRKKIADCQEQAQQIRNEVDKRLLEETSPLQNEIDILTEQIHSFAKRHFANTGERSKKLLLSGRRIGFRKGPVTFFYGNCKADKDNQALLAFCLDHQLSDFVKTEISETVDWSKLKKTLIVTESGKVVNSDGEIIENMRAEQADDVFFIS